MLLRTQKNELAKRIVYEGFDPTAFEPFVDFEPFPGAVATRLEHTDSGCYFDFFEGGDFQCSPGAETATDAGRTGGFGEQFVRFCHWLDNLKREINAPDLWSELRKESSLVQVARASPSENSSFTEPERSRIESGIEEIRRYLLESAAIEQKHHDTINQKLDEAAESSKRMGRKDWNTYILGTMTNLVLTVAMNPTQSAKLFRVFVNALGWVAVGHPLLPES